MHQKLCNSAQTHARLAAEMFPTLEKRLFRMHNFGRIGTKMVWDTPNITPS